MRHPSKLILQNTSTNLYPVDVLKHLSSSCMITVNFSYRSQKRVVCVQVKVRLNAPQTPTRLSRVKRGVKTNKSALKSHSPTPYFSLLVGIQHAMAGKLEWSKINHEQEWCCGVVGLQRSAHHSSGVTQRSARCAREWRTLTQTHTHTHTHKQTVKFVIMWNLS